MSGKHSFFRRQRRGPDEAAAEGETPGPAGEAGPGELLPGQKVLGPDPGAAGKKRGKLSRWVERRASKVVREIYRSSADDLEERAVRAVGTIYEERADDLEERAVRTLRRAIEAESHRIQAAIEHGVAVKKREVRLSLLVLVVSSLVYLVLYLLTGGS